MAERRNDGAGSDRLRSIALYPIYKLTRQTLKDFISGVLEALRQSRYALRNPAASFAGDRTRSRVIVTRVGSMLVKNTSHSRLLWIRDLNAHTLARAAFRTVLSITGETTEPASTRICAPWLFKSG